jgi:hypothetical protein
MDLGGCLPDEGSETWEEYPWGEEDDRHGHSCSASHRSASMAAMDPVPAAVTA